MCLLVRNLRNSSEDGNYTQITDLKSRIDDLRRIKQSLTLELRRFAKERNKILKEKTNLLNKNEKLLSQINHNKLQLRQLELDLSADRKQRSDLSCSSDHVAPIVFNPLKSVDLRYYAASARDYSLLSEDSDNRTQKISFTARRTKRIDYSICPLAGEFRFSLQNPNSSIHDLKLSLISQEGYKESVDVCVDLILVDTIETIHRIVPRVKNSIFINLGVGLKDDEYHQLFNIEHGLVSPYFPGGTYRDRVDIVIPSILQSPESFEEIVESMPLHSPLNRKYFAAYFGRSNYDSEADHGSMSQLENALQTIHRSSIGESFLFNYHCDSRHNNDCYSQREANIEKSIFLIIIPDKDYDLDLNTNELIYHALRCGTIPVIIVQRNVRLPFDEVIDWRRALILLPSARLPELHFVLKTYAPNDIYQLKYHGRRIFERYFATSKQIADTIISIIRLERFGHPPPPIKDIGVPVYFDSNQLLLDKNCTKAACMEAKADSLTTLLYTETLGPLEHPLRSPSFRRNYSLIYNSAYDLWNNQLFSPNYLFPSLPSDPVAPSEFKFFATDQGYRPIADGLGGSGYEFSRSLGGDYPNEQFTIVILTFERKALLMRTLERLKNTPYLNKVIVVWNGVNQRPSSDLVWPDIGSPIELAKVERNSLNNRFLPFESIETDAIFSMDDDSPLRPDEIVFAFRVWRESRDRIVGFPGRFHAWDNGQNTWLYNSNHSCELSMVLTGGAFFHKYYTYLYTYSMPKSIHSIVDKFMNCEDIAMNFLVAHLTRKPPLKVTSRWTFHCSSCLSSLSEDDSHFRERHECLNIFASIYGYMPLMNTQHRSDSILFKTRLPKDKQKCFKFV